MDAETLAKRGGRVAHFSNTQPHRDLFASIHAELAATNRSFRDYQLSTLQATKNLLAIGSNLLEHVPKKHKLLSTLQSTVDLLAKSSRGMNKYAPLSKSIQLVAACSQDLQGRTQLFKNLMDDLINRARRADKAVPTGKVVPAARVREMLNELRQSKAIKSGSGIDAMIAGFLSEVQYGHNNFAHYTYS